MFMNMYVHGYVYVYDSICWALKCPVHCAEPFLELKICISPQFRAIDPPNPARGFIQQNENVRFATAACMQKYGNVSFATVACAKCMRYGVWGEGGGTHTMGGGGGGWQHGTRNHIYNMMIHDAWYKIRNTLLQRSSPSSQATWVHQPGHQIEAPALFWPHFTRGIVVFECTWPQMTWRVETYFNDSII